LVRNISYAEAVDLWVSPPSPVLSVMFILREDNASLVFFNVALTTRGIDRLALDFNDSSLCLLVVLQNDSSFCPSIERKRLFKFRLGTVTFYVSPSNKLP
jgi:hypothetical protein